MKINIYHLQHSDLFNIGKNLMPFSKFNYISTFNFKITDKILSEYLKITLNLIIKNIDRNNKIIYDTNTYKYDKKLHFIIDDLLIITNLIKESNILYILQNIYKSIISSNKIIHEI